MKLFVLGFLTVGMVMATSFAHAAKIEVIQERARCSGVLSDVSNRMSDNHIDKLLGFTVKQLATAAVALHMDSREDFMNMHLDDATVGRNEFNQYYSLGLRQAPGLAKAGLLPKQIKYCYQQYLNLQQN